jgi:hypothetical protein
MFCDKVTEQFCSFDEEAKRGCHIPLGLGLAISGGAGLLGSLFSSNAAQNAAQTQAQAAEQASEIQQKEFNRIFQSLAPYRRTGTEANTALQRLLGLASGGGDVNASFLTKSPFATLGAPLEDVAGSRIDKQFQASPSYQFELGQGAQAIQNAGAGVTGALSGNTLKALQTYGTGLAGEDFWNWYNAQNQQYWQRYGALTGRQNQIYNMLTGLSGAGQNAAAQTGAFGQAAASQIGQNTIGAGNALAAGQIGSANALVGGLNSIGSLPLQSAILSQIYGGGGQAGGFLIPGTNTPIGGGDTASSYF